MAATGAIRVTSTSGALTVTFIGPSGGTPTVYSDAALTTTVSLPATVADATTSIFYVASPGAYTLSVKTGSGSQIAAPGNTTRTVNLQSPGTVASYSYDIRTASARGDSGLDEFQTDTETSGAYAPVTPTALKVSGANLFGVGDRAVERLMTASLQQAQDWLAWCQAAGSARPWIGEIGWPVRGATHLSEAQRWQAVGDAAYSWADAAGIPVCYWTARSNVPTTDLVQAYSGATPFPTVLNTAYLPAEVIEKHPTAGSAYRGVNWPEGYYGFTVGTAATDAAGGSNLSTGTFGTDYNYGSLADWQYLAGRGHKVVRLHFRLERLFSGASGTSASINATEVARLTAALTDIQTAGMQAILCASNFGLYYLDVAGTATAQYLGSAGFTQAQFTAMWTALSTAFKAHPAVLGYDLMGEPSGATSVAVWQAASQAAVTAIRANTDTKLILVEGGNSAGLGAWIQVNGPVGWITDSASNFAYSAHWYIGDASGAYTAATTIDTYAATAETLLLRELTAPGLAVPLGPGLGGKIETTPLQEAGSTLTLTGGSVYVTCFTAPFTFTVTTLKAGVGNAGGAASLTAARMAIATLDTQDQPTYVAETASDTTLFATAFTTYSRALSTARGGPASFTFVRGQRYALIVMTAGGTAPKLVGSAFVIGGLGLDVHPYNAYVAQTAQADLPAPGTTTAIGGYSSAPGRFYICAI